MLKPEWCYGVTEEQWTERVSDFIMLNFSVGFES
jgi:hypothetical protein